MSRLHFLIIFLIGVIMIKCSSGNEGQNNVPSAEELKLVFDIESNLIADDARYRASFTLENNSDVTLGNKGWAMYFTMVPRKVFPETVTGNAMIEHINGDFYRLVPLDGFILKPGESTTIKFEGEAYLVKVTDAPAGIYFVFTDDAGNEIKIFTASNYTINPFTRPEQFQRHHIEAAPIPTPEWQYNENQKVSVMDLNQLPLIIPTPKKMWQGEKRVILKNDLMIHYQEGLEFEAKNLSSQLSSLFGLNPSVMKADVGGSGIIFLGTEPSREPESYVLESSPEDGVRILGGNPAGVFYGIQSFLRLFPTDKLGDQNEEIIVPETSINDAPAFAYRGMHLDVGRNFQTKETVLKFIDALAFYKFNKLHMHLSEDEGWRLEIQELPELTQVGAFRGHTVDGGTEFLPPAYGSGGFADPDVSYGSGYYSRNDFKEIIQYAHQRHIEVIPEVNMPGHARAAIKAMENRYRRLLGEGKPEEAAEYLLNDFEDKSEYVSAQIYNDNVVCVCKESAYRFFETVVDDIIEMYAEAGVPLTTIHTGGDEVPRGVWTASPICEDFLKEHPEIEGPAGLQPYFTERAFEILDRKGLVTAGWEEIAMRFLNTGGWEPNKNLAGKKVLPYVWNSLWGNQEMAYRLANAGYPIILCNVTNFYFDLAYNRDPEEPGQYWGGLIDTKKAFEFIPYDLYKSSREDAYGQAFDRAEAFKDMPRLTEEGEKNIMGLQGELWSETIKGRDMLEYYFLPKGIGLAERAWSGQANWASISNDAKRDAKMEKDWGIFANRIGQFEMKLLDHVSGGFNYRIAPAGAIILDGKLLANHAYPGTEIRYTTDGTEPGATSSLYERPVEVQGTIKIKAFNTKGRGSRTITLVTEE